MRDAPSPLGQALIVRALRGDPPMVGSALAALRAAVLEGEHATHPAANAVAHVQARLMTYDIDTMPPDTDDVAILLETLSQRLGATGHAEAWRSIGVKPNRGRDLLARNARAVDWPIWKTIRDAALVEATARVAAIPEPKEPGLETFDRFLGPKLVELIEEFEDRRGELDGLPLLPDDPGDLERRENLEDQCREAESDIALLLVRTRQRLRRDPERIAALIDQDEGFGFDW